MNRRVFIAIFILISIISCATPDVPSMRELDSIQLHDDESRLWTRSREEQMRLNYSGYIYDDPILTAYVNSVAQNLIPDDLAAKGLFIKIKIVKNPLLNAFSYPNGVIYIHTGILTKMENEAQLATILGHEMSHITHRHTLENYRNVKNTTAIVATLQAAGAISLGAYADFATVLGRLGTAAAVTGYSKKLETEADAEGLKFLVQANYDPKEALRFFKILKRDLEEHGIIEPFFFGSHPRLQERIDNYNQFIKAKYAKAGGEKRTDAFLKKTKSLLLDNAMMDLSMGRFNSAQRDIERFLKIEPHNARAHYSLGELYRQRNAEDDINRAIDEYVLSVNNDPSYPAPHKALGIIYYKKEQKEKAKWEFERYLFLDPKAKDRGYIEQYIKELGQ